MVGTLSHVFALLLVITTARVTVASSHHSLSDERAMKYPARVKEPRTPLVWIVLSALLWLALAAAACGSVGGNKNPDAPAGTPCVLDQSKLGSCTL